MSAIHTSTVTAAHAYTRSPMPWLLEENREACGETTDGKKFGWRLFHYISSGGMNAFGRTVRQEEISYKRNRFLLTAGALAMIWLALLLA